MAEAGEQPEPPHYLDNLDAYLDVLREELKALAEKTGVPIHLLGSTEEYRRWQQRSYNGKWL